MSTSETSEPARSVLAPPESGAAIATSARPTLPDATDAARAMVAALRTEAAAIALGERRATKAR